MTCREWNQLPATTEAKRDELSLTAFFYGCHYYHLNVSLSVCLTSCAIPNLMLHWGQQQITVSTWPSQSSAETFLLTKSDKCVTWSGKQWRWQAVRPSVLVPLCSFTSVKDSSFCLVWFKCVLRSEPTTCSINDSWKYFWRLSCLYICSIKKF